MHIRLLPQRGRQHRAEPLSIAGDRLQSVHQRAEDSRLSIMIAVTDTIPAGLTPDLGREKEKTQAGRREMLDPLHWFTASQKERGHKEVEMKLVTIAFLTVTTAFLQTAKSHLPVTDAEKIADALRAGPIFIAKDATLLDWPSTPGGDYRVLREGSNGWTCLPAIPGYPHDEKATKVAN